MDSMSRSGRVKAPEFWIVTVLEGLEAIEKLQGATFRLTENYGE